MIDDIWRNKRLFSADDCVAASPRTGGSRMGDTLLSYFLATVDRCPSRPALVLHEDGSVVRYSELLHLALETASDLRHLGVSPGSVVVLHLPRGIAYYRAMVATLLLGAAFVPTDISIPMDRAAFICTDSGAVCLVTSPEKAASLRGLELPICVIPPRVSSVRQAEARLDLPASAPDSLAYIIYTSGTTGKPKGVAISNRAVAHWVASESSILQLRESDIVYQGFSPAFDMSIEEVWPAFMTGATLFVASENLVKLGPDIVPYLEEQHVTVLHCVPSLLGAFERPPRTVRLINSGGEALPQEVASRVLQSRPDIRLLNTYGPTETTVTATYAEVVADSPITIGRALPGYTTYVLTSEGHRAMPGVEGELAIGGPSLAEGYLNLPALTEQKFILAPVGEHGSLCRVYRTGDLVVQAPDGLIEYRGRIDAQVKLRGFRVELGEIEEVLLQDPAIAAAAVRLSTAPSGQDFLAAFIALHPGEQVDQRSIRKRLKAALPDYMVPAYIGQLPELPRLVSGKIDRKALPAIVAIDDLQEGEHLNQAQLELYNVWRSVLGPLPIRLGDDFFSDLGGNSLAAAQVVSRLRRLEGWRTLSVQDLYKRRTLETLSGCKTTGVLADGLAPRTFSEVPERRFYLCAIAQAFLLLPILSLFGLSVFGPYALVAGVYALDDVSAFEAVLCGLAAMVWIPPFLLVASVVTKWLVIGRYRSGRYPLWGAYYLRWWFVRRMHNLVPLSYIAGTPLMALYYRMLGAHVGKGCILGSIDIDGSDLITIGEGTMVQSGSILSSVAVEDGWLVLGPVTIGSDCAVGYQSVLGRGVVAQDGVVIEDLTLIPNEATLAVNTRWQGSPAQELPPIARPPLRHLSRSRRFATSLGLSIAAILLPWISATPFIPGMFALVHTDMLEEPLASSLRFVPLLSVIYFLGTVALMIVGKWVLLGRLSDDSFSVYSVKYIRFWIVTQLFDLCHGVIHSSFATLFTPLLFRALGATIGRRTEVSTALYTLPDQVKMGDEAFIADAVVIGAPRFDRGLVSVGEVEIGTRTFLGNSAVVPIGTKVADGALIGVLSVPPTDPGQQAERGATWLGSPAQRLNDRRSSMASDQSATFRPPWWLIGVRAGFELVRIHLSLILLVALTIVILAASYTITEDEVSVLALIGCVSAIYSAAGVGLFGVVVLLKWATIGTYTARTAPLWSTFVWRSELVTATYEALAIPMLLTHLRGTPFLGWALRCLGANIGRRVFIDTTDITEFDLVTVGDDAALNEACGLQTHLFEDRVMKVGPVVIGPRAVVGASSIVLLHGEVAAGASVGDLSLVMKGETIPEGSSWLGIPCQPERRSAVLPAAREECFSQISA